MRDFFNLIELMNFFIIYCKRGAFMIVVIILIFLFIIVARKSSKNSYLKHLNRIRTNPKIRKRNFRRREFPDNHIDRM